jgi:hypothetical protein
MAILNEFAFINLLDDLNQMILLFLLLMDVKILMTKATFEADQNGVMIIIGVVG